MMSEVKICLQFHTWICREMDFLLFTQQIYKKKHKSKKNLRNRRINKKS